jgi:hypothetical protein
MEVHLLLLDVGVGTRQVRCTVPGSKRLPLSGSTSVSLKFVPSVPHFSHCGPGPVEYVSLTCIHVGLPFIYTCVWSFPLKLYLFYFVVLGIEFRALHSQSRCSTTWATPTPLFVLVMLEIGSCFLPDHPGLRSFYFKLPAVAGLTGTHHCAQLLVEIGSHKIFTKAGLELRSSCSQPPNS